MKMNSLDFSEYVNYVFYLNFSEAIISKFIKISLLIFSHFIRPG